MQDLYNVFSRYIISFHKIQLDGEMTGKNPITGKSNTLTKINGLTLYNGGANPINLNAGNMAALTATFSK
jgi:hypothetical protein